MTGAQSQVEGEKLFSYTLDKMSARFAGPTISCPSLQKNVIYPLLRTAFSQSFVYFACLVCVVVFREFHSHGPAGPAEGRTGHKSINSPTQRHQELWPFIHATQSAVMSCWCPVFLSSASGHVRIRHSTSDIVDCSSRSRVAGSFPHQVIQHL